MKIILTILLLSVSSLALSDQFEQQMENIRAQQQENQMRARQQRLQDQQFQQQQQYKQQQYLQQQDRQQYLEQQKLEYLKQQQGLEILKDRIQQYEQIVTSNRGSQRQHGSQQVEKPSKIEIWNDPDKPDISKASAD